MPRRMHMDQSTEVSYSMTKLLSVWALYVGITSWQEAAAFAAFVYTLLLILEWLYKKLWVGIFNKNDAAD